MLMIIVKEQQIVAKAYFLVVNSNAVLVHRVLSSKKEKELVRPPGGHVEFGEYSKDTVKREALEEIGVALENIRFLGPLENIFKDPDCNIHHEIIFVYKADLADKALYKHKVIHCKELDGRKFDMFWVPIKSIEKGKVKFVPKGMDSFLRKTYE